jgi:lantibiotic biosynthesis protein
MKAANANSPSPFAAAVRYRTVAENIAARLCRDALWDRDRCNWMGSAMEPINGAWTVTRRSFGPDLYSGTSGIALFLGRVRDANSDPILRKVVAGAVSHAISQSHDLAPATRLGFYCGGTGIAAALQELGEKFDRQDWIDHGDALIRALANDDPETQPIDVIAGSAGAIPMLLRLNCQRKNAVVMDLALKHGQRLIRDAHRHEYGWSWPTITEAKRDLLGFSHGTAGIAWSLLELYAVSRDAVYREAAEQAIAYEQHWFNAEQKNWPDFRDHSSIVAGSTSNQPVFTIAWCHGAPGIGLSRLRAFDLTHNRDYLAQAENAIATTIASITEPSALAASQCLCHGALGNLDLLLYARSLLRTDAHDSIIERFADAAIFMHETTNGFWPCGVLGGGETPGLLLGLAGIGHFYLSLAMPAEIPSVLLPSV